jgi:hypothetical protein
MDLATLHATRDVEHVTDRAVYTDTGAHVRCVTCPTYIEPHDPRATLVTRHGSRIVCAPCAIRLGARLDPVEDVEDGEHRRLMGQWRDATLITLHTSRAVA